MTTTYQIPLQTGPQTFSMSLPSGIYNFRLIYANAPDGQGGWLLDIDDQNSNPLLLGLPLTTGADLLEPFEYLGLGIALYALTQGDQYAAPTFANLGVTSGLYFQVNS